MTPSAESPLTFTVDHSGAYQLRQDWQDDHGDAGTAYYPILGWAVVAGEADLAEGVRVQDTSLAPVVYDDVTGDVLTLADLKYDRHGRFRVVPAGRTSP